MKAWNVNVRYGYDNNIDDIDNITLITRVKIESNPIVIYI